MNAGFDRCVCGDLRSGHHVGEGRCLFVDCGCPVFTLSTVVLTHAALGGSPLCSVWRPGEIVTTIRDGVDCPTCLRIRAKREEVPPEILAARADGYDAGVRAVLDAARSGGIVLTLETLDGSPWPNPYRKEDG